MTAIKGLRDDTFLNYISIDDSNRIRTVDRSDITLGQNTYSEDVTSGITIGTVRNDNLANTLAGTNNEISPLSCTSVGELFIKNSTIESNTTSISTNTLNTANSTANIDTSTANIDTSTASIDTSTANIDTNTTSIATNTLNTANSTASIDTKNSTIISNLATIIVAEGVLVTNSTDTTKTSQTSYVSTHKAISTTTGIRNDYNTIANNTGNSQYMPMSLSRYGEIFTYKREIGDSDNFVMNRMSHTLYDTRFYFNYLPDYTDLFEFNVIQGSVTLTYRGGQPTVLMNTLASIYRISTFYLPYMQNLVVYFTPCIDSVTNSNAGFTYEFGLTSLIDNTGIIALSKISAVLSSGSVIALRFFQDHDGGIGQTVSQASFNLDKLDGTGESGITINHNSLRRYALIITWYPLQIIWAIENSNGRLVYFHRFYNNVSISSNNVMYSYPYKLFNYIYNNSATNYSGNIGTTLCGFHVETSLPMDQLYGIKNTIITTAVSCAANANTQICSIFYKPFDSNNDNVNTLTCIRPVRWYAYIRNTSGAVTIADVEIRLYYLINQTIFAGEVTTGYSLNYALSPGATLTGATIIDRQQSNTIPISTTTSIGNTFNARDFVYFGNSYLPTAVTRNQPLLIFTCQNNDASTAASVKIMLQFYEV